MLQNLRDGYALATDAYVIAQNHSRRNASNSSRCGHLLELFLMYQPNLLRLTMRPSAWQLDTWQGLRNGPVCLMSSHRYHWASNLQRAANRSECWWKCYTYQPSRKCPWDLTSMSIRTWCQQQSMRARSLLSPRSIEIFESQALTLAANVPNNWRD
jgi:hypothetical protein